MNKNKIQEYSFPFADGGPIHLSHSLYQTSSISFDVHLGLEIGIVLKGETKRFFPDYEATYKRGEFWICNSWEVHGRQIVKAPYEGVVLIISPIMVASLNFEEAPNFNWMAPFLVEPPDRPRIRKSKQKRVLEIAEELIRIKRQRDEYDKLHLRILTIELLLILQRVWGISDEYRKQLVLYPLVTDAIHLALPGTRLVTTNEAAAAAHMNRNKFSSTFKKLMGMPYSEFTMKTCLMHAKSQLLQTQNNLDQIAASSGFTDASHLYRSFKKIFQCTPGDYRKKHQT